MWSLPPLSKTKVPVSEESPHKTQANVSKNTGKPNLHAPSYYASRPLSQRDHAQTTTWGRNASNLTSRQSRKPPALEGASTTMDFIGAFNFASRRYSLPNRLDFVENPSKLAYRGTPRLDERAKSARRGSVDFVNRDIRCMRRNSVEDRRLQSQVLQLEKRSFAESLQRRHKKNELLKNFKRTMQLSPSADEWLASRKSRTTSWQVRERDDIDKRYGRRIRQFRAPPDLQPTVAKVRTYALLETGLLRYVPKEKAIEQDEEENISKMTSLNIARRHTLCGDGIASQLPSGLDYADNTFRRLERRMTLPDIQSIKEVLNAQRNQELVELHDSSDDENGTGKDDRSDNDNDTGKDDRSESDDDNDAEKDITTEVKDSKPIHPFEWSTTKDDDGGIGTEDKHVFEED